MGLFEKLLGLTEDVNQKYQNGNTYKGQMRSGKKDGQGIYTYSNGDIYEGEFSDDKRHGKGMYTFVDGRVYNGDWLEDKQTGYAKFTFVNGSTYEGEWLNAKYHGKGKYTFADGRFYEGEFSGGKRHGKGKYTFADGRVYDGDWLEGKQTGYAKFIYTDGSIYEGDWLNGEYYGFGKKIYANGDIHEGNWKKHERNGLAKYIWASGNVYEGEWHNGIRIGAAKIILVNGEVYEGQYNNIKLPENEIFQDIKLSKLDKLLSELDSFIGLSGVKNNITTMINLLRMQKMREEAGLTTPTITKHLVFTGNPGTGKTTVARLVAQIYKELGVLSKGHFIECDRSKLVGSYIGSTAQLTTNLVKQAIGGILFIDEAYTLYKEESAKDFGQEAIDTLLKLMEDNRDNLIVIVAGYKNEMTPFLESNPGLKSRFKEFIHFEDYNADELLSILDLELKKGNLILTNSAREEIQSLLNNLVDNKTKDFANGRLIRNIFEDLLKAQANRLATSSDVDFDDIKTMQIITLEDVKCIIDINYI